MAAHPGDIHRAAGDGDLRVLKATPDAYPDAARDRDRDGLLPLHLAAKYGRAAAVKMLLDVYPEAARLKGGFIGPPSGAQYPLEFAVEGSIIRAQLPTTLDHLPHYLQHVRVTVANLDMMQGSTPDFVGTAKVLLDAYPEAPIPLHFCNYLRHWHLGNMRQRWFQLVPELQMMIELSAVGHPPSRPWTTATPRALRRLTTAETDATMDPLKQWPSSRYMNRRYAIVAPILLAHLSRVRDVVLVVRRCGLPAHLAPVIAGALYALELW